MQKGLNLLLICLKQDSLQKSKLCTDQYWIAKHFKQHCLFYFSDSFGGGAKVVRMARVPMGGWAEEGQSAPRHHEPVPEESSEDEMPPHVHRVKAVCGKLECQLKIYKCVSIKIISVPFLLL